MSLILGAVTFPQIGKDLFKPVAWRLQIVRAVLAVVATALFYQGLSVLPLGESTAIMCLAAPIAVILSALVLRERANWLQWSAIALGLIGGLLVLRPGGGLFSFAALLPLAGAVTWAGFMICSRVVGAIASPKVTTFWTSLWGGLLLTPLLPLFAQVPNSSELLICFMVIGVLGAVGQLLTAMAYRYGATPLVAPIAYVSLGVAVLIGWARFGDRPDLIALFGIVFIAIGGITVTVSQHQQARQ